MRVVLTGFGSTGDFEPFLALAIELQCHGHQPVLAFPPQYAAHAMKHNVVFVPLGSNVLLEALQMGIPDEIAHGPLQKEQLRERYPLHEMIKMFHDLLAVCLDQDILICSAEWPFGQMIHELIRIPYVSVHLDYFNEEFARENSAQLAESEQQLALSFNSLRRQLGLQLRYHPLTTDGISEQLALFAVSRLMLDPAKEQVWPAHYHVTGFYLLEPEPWKPDPQLEAFLSAGEPPIVVTFGSMVYQDPNAMVELVLDSIAQVNCRAIVQRGWANLTDTSQMPPNIFFADFVPYHWLFPRIACVVQAAGAGTTAWALQLGIPTITIPHIWQQYSFARFANYYGCGPTIPYRELTAERLSTAITDVLTNASYREAALRVSAQMRTERGVAVSRELIEQWYAQISSPQSLSG